MTDNLLNNVFTGFDIAAPPADLEVGSVYQATLTGFKPFTYTDPASGDERQLVEWQFVVEDGDTVTEVSGTTTTATGPKSKAYRWLVAAVGAGSVKPGAHFDPSALVGREVMVTIGENKNGWPKVDEVVPLPKAKGR